MKAWREGEALQIATLIWRYDRLRPDAITQNLISSSNGQAFDVPGRTQSPYFQDTVYTTAFLQGSVNSLSPLFSFPVDLWISNLSATPEIQVDAGDGIGWQPIKSGGSIQANYRDTGTVDVKLRFTYPNGLERYAHTTLRVLSPPSQERGWSSEPDESIEITGAQPYLGEANTGTMHIFYNCGSKKMLKPLIVVEGIEFGLIGGVNISSSWQRLMLALKAPVLVNSQSIRNFIEPEGYDIIYVDWADGKGADYIQRNAYMIERVIQWVNQQKAEAGSAEPNVVLGFSMGGLVADYALLDMQAKGLSHDTRLFMSYDAPLQGRSDWF
jgi:hypothetical protein